MNLSSRDRRALVVGGVGLAAMLVMRFALIPWIDAWMDHRAELVVGRERVDRVARQLRSVLRRRKRLAKAYGPAANLPPQDVEAAGLSLPKAALGVLNSNGFGTTEYLPQRPKRVQGIEGLRVVSLQVSGGCKLPQLTKCLSALRKTETLVMVDRLSVTSDPKKPGQLKVTMVLTTLGEQREDGS